MSRFIVVDQFQTESPGNGLRSFVKVDCPQPTLFRLLASLLVFMLLSLSERFPYVTDSHQPVSFCQGANVFSRRVDDCQRQWW